MAERDYVLGTDEVEYERLGLQHRVWRPEVLTVWRSAGITAGSRVLDVGCGPGYATEDLGAIVGRSGEVVGIERSERFLDRARERCSDLGWVRFIDQDLMAERLPVEGFDFAWCRWVASFVPDPKRLVSNIANALKHGGKAIYHDYFDYEAWTMAPRLASHERFVSGVVSNWVKSGGCPDVMRRMVGDLSEVGMRIESMRPITHTIRPDSYIWQWPKTFVESHAPRLVDAGVITQSEADAFLGDFERASSDPASVMLTPIVAEIVAVKD